MIPKQIPKAWVNIMANIFANLQVYAGKWSEKSRRNFSAEEQQAVDYAEVVESQFGNSVCFHMVGGGQTFIPLSNTSSLVVGDKVDVSKAQIVTLEKSGESDINRIEA